MTDQQTIDSLVTQMLLRFVDEECPDVSEEYEDSHPNVVLTLLKWYMNPEDIAKLFLNKYLAACDGEDKLAVARVFRYWQINFSDDFRYSPEVRDALFEVLSKMKENDDTELLEYMELDQLSEDRWGRSNSIKTPQRLGHIRRPSLGFDTMSAEDLAEIVSSIDYKLFRRIPFREFCVYAQEVRLSDGTQRIEECIRIFNGITCWVICNILREYTMIKRSDTIEKFIDTTRFLYESHSYNAMLAVVGGLNHFSVRRLQQTWNKVDKTKKEELEKWTSFFSMDANYGAYRHRFQSVPSGDFRHPVLGIQLKDLVAIDSQQKDHLDKEKGSLSMAKYKVLWQHLSKLRMCQLTPPPFIPDGEHMSVLRAAMTQSEMSDDALEELSQIREPPVSDDSKSSPTRRESKLPKFADWASGNMPQLDADQVKKHVAKMVDSVFRIYDKDQSGYISIDEFQIISSNFPFIESFSVLDRDKDGVISREEMMDYFLSANTALRDFFKHNFVEHTFIATAYCEHCKGVLKGIVKQGVRCKDCGICCHKHCKDYVVVDCSKHTKDKQKRQRKGGSVSASNGEYSVDDEMTLKERLRRAEAARDALSAENTELHAKLAEANAKIQQLNGYIAMIRQHTIGFILEQMNTLQPQMDTAV